MHHAHGRHDPRGHTNNTLPRIVSHFLLVVVLEQCLSLKGYTKTHRGILLALTVGFGIGLEGTDRVGFRNAQVGSDFGELVQGGAGLQGQVGPHGSAASATDGWFHGDVEVVLQDAAHVLKAPVVAGLVVEAEALAGVARAGVELVAPVALGGGDVIDKEAGAAQDLPLSVVVEGRVVAVVAPGSPYDHRLARRLGAALGDG